MVSFLMTIVGDKEYLEKKEFKMWKNTYLKKDNDFNGFVLFHSLDGAYVNGWRFENGKSVATVTQLEYNPLPVILKSTTCYVITLPEITYRYVEWYVNGEYDRTQYISTTSTVLSQYEVCQDYGGGGGDGTYDPPSPEPDTKLKGDLKLLFEKTMITDEDDIKTLNDIFEKMNLDCMYGTITNVLKEKNVRLGTISINSNLPGAAAINTNGDLTFQGSWAITEENLSHEWFHVGQREINSVTDAYDGYMEFEAWLFADIKETVRITGNFGSSNHTFACYKSNMDVYKTQYQNWLMTITNNGTSFPTSFNDMNFRYWGPIFGNVRNYHWVNFNNTSYFPKTMFDLINSCN